MTAALALAPIPRVEEPRMQFVRLPGEPAREYYAFTPATLRAGAEPLVLVHGISRNAAEMVLRFSELASQCGVPLIAPLFRQEVYGQYQQLLDRKRRLRSDRALLDILDDAAKRFGLATSRCALFGFSGGAQFVHRFAMLHPRRVRVCVPASAGWYTMPDSQLPWPLGLKDMPGGGGLAPEAMAVPFHQLVGQRDTADDDALRRNPEIDRLQGVNRRARARAWHRALGRAGWSSESSLTVLEGTRHSFSCAHRHGLAETVLRLIGYEGPAL